VLSVARTATACAATAARRSSRTHSAAGGTLVATALETKHRHHFFHFVRIAFWTINRFITSENQSFKFLTTTAAFVFINGHMYSPIKTNLDVMLATDENFCPLSTTEAPRAQKNAHSIDLGALCATNPEFLLFLTRFPCKLLFSLSEKTLLNHRGTADTEKNKYQLLTLCPLCLRG
jgi:hypothetical protein